MANKIFCRSKGPPKNRQPYFSTLSDARKCSCDRDKSSDVILTAFFYQQFEFLCDFRVVELVLYCVAEGIHRCVSHGHQCLNKRLINCIVTAIHVLHLFCIHLLRKRLLRSQCKKHIDTLWISITTKFNIEPFNSQQMLACLYSLAYFWHELPFQCNIQMLCECHIGTLTIHRKRRKRNRARCCADAFMHC